MIYQLDTIEYLFVFFQLDIFRAYRHIFRSNGGVLKCNTPPTHTPQDRHLTTPRTPYAAYVKKL